MGGGQKGKSNGDKVELIMGLEERGITRKNERGDTMDFLKVEINRDK